MTDDEAMRWLKRQADCGCLQAMQLVQMLSEPRLPNEPSAGAVNAMRAAFDVAYLNSPFIEEATYRALYARLTKPATKTMWRVTFQSPDKSEGGGDDYSCHAAALTRVEFLTAGDWNVTILKREVPA